MTNVILYVAAGSAAVYLGYLLFERLQLSLAKHRSLRGHARMARRVARILPFYEYDETRFFRSDDPPADIEDGREKGKQPARVEHGREHWRYIVFGDAPTDGCVNAVPQYLPLRDHSPFRPARCAGSVENAMCGFAS